MSLDQDGFWKPEALPEDVRAAANLAVARALLEESQRVLILQERARLALEAYRNRSLTRRFLDWLKTIYWYLCLRPI
ncbi:hypothetical protein [Acidithiobacillus sp.]|uniref:hypothetical protein n=1 Tax=Acidithiobacillus sp. TaxID=1872118 RepID=UPI002588F229|nr:hypothetical protein [Acidithiobacillus sp.]MDD5374439.1 hypothetical protein [Acidithiobacillus sp.]